MDTYPKDSTRNKAPKRNAPVLRCRICDKPISTETAKTDGDGKAIHEECYAVKVKLEQASIDGHAKSTRPWKVVAAEVSREQNPEKFTELVTELNQALNEQNVDGTPKSKGDGATKPTS